MATMIKSSAMRAAGAGQRRAAPAAIAPSPVRLATTQMRAQNDKKVRIGLGTGLRHWPRVGHGIGLWLGSPCLCVDCNSCHTTLW